MAAAMCFFTHPAKPFELDPKLLTVHKHRPAVVQHLLDCGATYVTFAMIEEGKLVSEDLVITRQVEGPGDHSALVDSMADKLLIRNSRHACKRNSAPVPSVFRPATSRGRVR